MAVVQCCRGGLSRQWKASRDEAARAAPSLIAGCRWKARVEASRGAQPLMRWTNPRFLRPWVALKSSGTERNPNSVEPSGLHGFSLPLGRRLDPCPVHRTRAMPKGRLRSVRPLRPIRSTNLYFLDKTNFNLVAPLFLPSKLCMACRGSSRLSGCRWLFVLVRKILRLLFL